MRTYLPKPKKLAYLLLFLFLVQICAQIVRHRLTIDQWETYENSVYGYSLKFPGNWTLEEYPGKYRSHNGVVAIIGDSSGFFPASRLLIVYWRPSETPSLVETANWGEEVIRQQNGTDSSSLEEIVVGYERLPALKQSFNYAIDYDGFNIYMASENAEYVFLFGSKEVDAETLAIFDQIVESISIFR